MNEYHVKIVKKFYVRAANDDDAEHTAYAVEADQDVDSFEILSAEPCHPEPED